MESPVNMESDLSQLQWDVVSLRMTAFPAPGSEVTKTDWWKSGVDEPPELIEQPRTGEIVEMAKRGNGELELQIDPLSLSWFQRVPEVHQENEPEVLGKFRSSCEEFCVLMMSKWFKLNAVPNLVRLAFGAILIQPVQSQEEGLKRLGRYIPAVNLDPPPSSSFLYQINRRRASELEIEELKINRVMKWSLTKYQLLRTHPDGRVKFTQAPQRSYIRLELDINTIQEFEGEFQREHASQVFSELVELGTEIAEKGDIP